MQVVDMLFRNLVMGNFCANCWRCRFKRAHSGILKRKLIKVNFKITLHKTGLI